jgi:hypothetical protein
VSRPCRIDMRLTEQERAKLVRRAKTAGCTLTEVVAELIGKLP